MDVVDRLLPINNQTVRAARDDRTHLRMALLHRLADEAIDEGGTPSFVEGFILVLGSLELRLRASGSKLCP